MTSPSKRPAVTYHRGPRNKIPASSDAAFKSSSLLLNPDVALQQKINDLLVSKEGTHKAAYQPEEEEFDSAYHETTGNAKKVHDLVQVGETRRFIDEIEYSLDGLRMTGPKSLPTVHSSLEEIVEKCFDGKDKCVNVAFGMKLKSHGALGIIFESLNVVEDDPIIFDNLILLISALLFDVRRLDFFFKPEMAIKIVRHCLINDRRDCAPEEIASKLKYTQVFKEAQDFNAKESFIHVALWILYKWSFSSVTTAKSSSDSKSFFDLLIAEKGLLKRLIDLIVIPESRIGIREQAAGLMDCLLNNRKNSLVNVLKDDLIKFLNEIVHSDSLNEKNVVCMKLVVSITGSSIGKDLATENSVIFFDLVKKLIRISGKGREIEILSLSSLINLIDRCEDSVLDEFRYQKCEESGCSVLGHLGKEFSSKIDKNDKNNKEEENSMQKSLLALLLAFLCRQNRTNLQVMLQDQDELAIKREIFTVASNFLLQQEANNSMPIEEDNKLVIERLREVVITFKS